MTRKPRDGWADFHECSSVPWSLCSSKGDTRGACRSLRARVSRHDDSPFSLPVATSYVGLTLPWALEGTVALSHLGDPWHSLLTRFDASSRPRILLAPPSRKDTGKL